MKRHRKNSIGSANDDVGPGSKKVRLELQPALPESSETVSTDPNPMINPRDIKVEDPGWDEDYNPWGLLTANGSEEQNHGFKRFSVSNLFFTPKSFFTLRFKR